MRRCVAVTGATGFVGGALTARLVADKEWRVRALVRTVPAAGIADTEVRLAGDLSGHDYGAGLLNGCEAVVHCAARVHVMQDRAQDPLAAFRVHNVEATRTLALAAVAAGVRRFVYVSSIKVNGEQTVPGRPFLATDAPAPRDPYGVSKQEAEMALREIASRTGLQVLIVRPPLVYGRGAGGNFAALAALIRRGWPLPFGAISGNRRSLVSVDNLVDLIVHCLDAADASPADPLLVSDGEDMSTSGLVRRMAAAMDRPPRQVPVPPAVFRAIARLTGKPGVAERLCGSLQVDIAGTKAALGWVPPIGVDAGLRRAFQARPPVR